MFDPLLAGAGALLFLVFLTMGVLMVMRRWRQRPIANAPITPNTIPMPQNTPATVHLYSAHPIYDYSPGTNLLVSTHTLLPSTNFYNF